LVLERPELLESFRDSRVDINTEKDFDPIRNDKEYKNEFFALSKKFMGNPGNNFQIDSFKKGRSFPAPTIVTFFRYYTSRSA
jgi:hypothetical protein